MDFGDYDSRVGRQYLKGQIGKNIPLLIFEQLEADYQETGLPQKYKKQKLNSTPVISSSSNTLFIESRSRADTINVNDWNRG